MSHEIRTPMNAIIGFSQLGMYETSDEELCGFHSEINIASTELLEIINDVLDYSNMDPNKMQLDVIWSSYV